MAWRSILWIHLVGEGLAQAIDLLKQQAFPVDGIFTYYKNPAAYNAQLSGTDRRSDVAAIATPDIPLTVETQWCGLLKFANAPTKYSDLGFRCSAEAHGKYNLTDWQ